VNRFAATTGYVRVTVLAAYPSAEDPREFSAYDSEFDLGPAAAPHLTAGQG